MTTSTPETTPEVPKDLQVRPRMRLLSSWVQYIPLMALTLAALILAVGGQIYIHFYQFKPTEGAAVNPTVSTSATVAPDTLTSGKVPDACTFHPGPLTTFKADDEKRFSEHAQEVGETYEGLDHFRFLGDLFNSSASQAIGRLTYNDAHIAAWKSYFTRLDADLSARGITFVPIIAPAKWEVYPDKLPTWMQEMRGSSPALSMYTRGAPFPAVWTADAVIKASSMHPTYGPDNTHWNEWGAYNGFQAMLDCLKAKNPAFDNLKAPVVEQWTAGDTPSEFPEKGWPVKDTNWYVPSFQAPMITTTYPDGHKDTQPGTGLIDLALLPATSTQDGNSTGPRVLFARDSMGNALSPFMNSTFRQVDHVAHQIGSDHPLNILQAVDTYKPQIVVLEIAERYLATDPALLLNTLPQH